MASSPSPWCCSNAGRGENPFRRTNFVETLHAIVHAIVHDALPALDYPAGSAKWELNRILQKALAKETENRYQTMKDLGIDLRRLKQETGSGNLSSRPMQSSIRLQRAARAPSLVQARSTSSCFPTASRCSSPILILANAEGLTWITGGVLFSEMTGRGEQMGIVTSQESRTAQRTVYMPRRKAAWRTARISHLTGSKCWSWR